MFRPAIKVSDLGPLPDAVLADVIMKEQKGIGLVMRGGVETVVVDAGGHHPYLVGVAVSCGEFLERGGVHELYG